jgi:hypothetical protein
MLPSELFVIYGYGNAAAIHVQAFANNFCKLPCSLPIMIQMIRIFPNTGENAAFNSKVKQVRPIALLPLIRYK